MKQKKVYQILAEVKTIDFHMFIYCGSRRVILRPRGINLINNNIRRPDQADF